MRKRILGAVLVALAPGSATADDAAILDKDFRVLMDWFPGVYDNQEQVYFEEELEVAEDLRHERIHHVFKKVELPAFGDNVLYVQQHLNDDPEQIYRQRLYVFTPDYDENAVRLTIHAPKNTEALVDAHLDPGKLSGLTLDDTVIRPGCEVYWKRQANQFVGYMHDGACSFHSQRSGKRIVIDDDLVLTESELWISDRAEDEDGNYVFGHKAGVPHKNRKARRFECWVAVQQADEDWTFKQGLEIYDQGGFVWIETEEEAPKRIGIKLRNVEWPYGNNRPSLVLYAYRETADRAVSYAWAEPTAERIGLNLRWMQGSCTHTP